MFKLESYITPILLSYVDKYIKNFRLEDSQVSLWGGDASFHNLDLRLEVLEQELQLPFSFVSGHIRELLIHVPWTKLASEPITITINTIECILKLKGSDSSSESAGHSKEARKRSMSRHELEAPPGYLSNLISKIVGNIRILCNNLILKYVEEDIVLSMNVKHLKFESANEKWESAFTDLSPDEITIRKIICVNDLTICLDKRNASGKIEIYQEPMLYKCSMTMHLLRTYNLATANKNSTTRLDMYCNNMEFGISEQQIPMCVRLSMLLIALQEKKKEMDYERDMNITIDPEYRENFEGGETWTGWAWSYVSSVLPAPKSQEELISETMIKSGHVMQIGLYIDSASMIFKVTETTRDRGSFAHRKLRYMPVLILELQGLYSETIMHGPAWLTSTFGISEILLCPLGHCSCSDIETPDGCKPNPYLIIGSPANFHKNNSLFDVDAIENKGAKKFYNTSWDYHVITFTESILLGRTPALAMDFIYEMAVPDDMSLDRVSELSSIREYSNLPERDFLRLFLAPLKLRLCSGFCHRTSSLIMAATTYDYVPYFIPKPDAEFQDLLPPSEEDVDALTQCIPINTIKITIFAPVIEIELADHPSFIPKKGKLYKKHKKISTHCQVPQQKKTDLPKVTIECQCLNFTLTQPFYVNRLVNTTCQLLKPPKQLFEACFKKYEMKVFSLCSRLVFNSKCQTTIVVPFNASFMNKAILKPQYWLDPDVTQTEVNIDSENLTLNGTKAKVMLINHIISSLLQTDLEDHLSNSSLLTDATSDTGFPYIEFFIEGMRFRKVATCSTVSVDVSLGGVKGFIFETVEKGRSISTIASFSNYMNQNIQQILFISGPEPKKSDISDLEEKSLLTATIQYPVNPDVQVHPTILVYNIREIRICVDPLVSKWFLYTPKYHYKADLFSNFLDNSYKIKGSESSANAYDSSRKVSIPLESVHSNSDKDHMGVKKAGTVREEPVDLQERIYSFLKSWFDVWKGMVLCGNISQCTIYFPLVSLSAIGSQGIQEAVDEATHKKDPVDIMIITLPFSTNHSAQRANISKYLTRLPVKLPENIWSPDRSSFPWTMSVSDIGCYTIQNGDKLDFLKAVSLSSTVGLSTKSSKIDLSHEKASDTQNVKSDIGSLGVCVHIDTTPILICTSEVQVYLFASILYGLMEVFSNLSPTDKPSHKSLEQTTTVSRSVSAMILTENSPDAPSHHTSSMNMIVAPDPEGNDNVKLTAWIQWTITRFTVELHSCTFESVKEKKKTRPKLKLVIDAEDIVSSIDFQNVYLKIKNKVGSISVEHFKLDGDKWVTGPYLGIVMKHRDDVLNEDRLEDNAFISITITRASCQHTHTLWGTLNRKKKETKTESNPLNTLSPSRYITEVVVTIQPTDFIFSFHTLRTFYVVLEPLLDIPVSKKEKHSPNISHLNNQVLPLAYLDCHDIRIIFPLTDDYGMDISHDVYVVQIGKISLSPTAVNPICRTPYRPDIYQHAARTRILNMPGSDLEDRQYQLDIFGLSVSTGLWKNVEQMLNQPISILSNFHGTSENPALEWNYLEKGQVNVNPTLIMWLVLEKCDISVVAAPAMSYKGVLICCNSLEINIMTDIMVNLSPNQIKVALLLVSELTHLLQPITTGKLESNLKLPYSKFMDTFEDSDLEVFRDSGIESFEFKSMASSRRPSKFTTSTSVNTTTVPNEMLFTAGKITISFFKTDPHYSNSLRNGNKSSHGLLGKNASKIGEKRVEEFIPLLFVNLSQPSVYLSDQQMVQKLHFCLFNFILKMGSPESCPIMMIPTEKHYQISLMETLSGSPHPDTGIPPAFLTAKISNKIASNLNLDIEIARPTKTHISTKDISHLLSINEEIANCFTLKGIHVPANVKTKRQTESSIPLKLQESMDHYVKFLEIKEILHGIDTVNIRSNQLVFVIATGSDYNFKFTVGKVRNNFTLFSRPDKICNVLSLECVSLLYEYNFVSQLILKPWSVTLEGLLFWDPWQLPEDDPQIQLTVESDCLMLEICPERIKRIQELLEDIQECMSLMSDISADIEEEVIVKNITVATITTSSQAPIDIEQHYKDDLRAGVFQFVDSTTNNADELPLPYQVKFWTKNISAMAWRYPHPRCLTKVRAFPVPYRVVMDTPNTFKISCQLEYWSECHASYIPYTQFLLPENEILLLNLPPANPQPTVACTWRIVLSVAEAPFSESSSFLASFSPRALAACMRIDSYFNKTLIPNLTAAFLFSKIHISLYTSYDKERCKVLPNCLKGYTPDMMFPFSHCFGVICAENLRLHLASWQFEMFSFDITHSFSCSVLDYAFLTLQNFIEPFSSKTEISIANNLNCNFISKPILIKFSPSIAHTLAVSSQLWNQNFNSSYEDTDLDFLIVTRYVICNDTNIALRFGQNCTNEDILLMPKHFHLYCWRSQKHKQSLKVALEKKCWIWSKPFTLEDGTKVVELSIEHNISLNVTVKSLSETQFQVIFSGQLIIANMLLEHFEVKVIEETENDKIITNHVATGNTISSSIVINFELKHFLRLRFYGLDASWSGDIPLMEHTKSVQPWLVKVPLMEKGQFLSIWCRVVIQEYNGRRLLAMLWPLFTLQSNLPVIAKLHIETPTLNFHSDCAIEGKGTIHQLYCPGTIDHSHQLTFQLNNVNSPSNPYVPLNYSLVDHQTFFKRMDKEDFDDIIDVLKNYHKPKWPHFGNELDNIDWIIEEQPETHVQVRYKNSCQYSSSLMVELIPWCLMVNTLGCPIGIKLDGTEVCTVRHNGIVAPPKLEENFHIFVHIGSKHYISDPLQFAKSNNWSNTFYMPKISGIIPTEGNIITSVNCEKHVCRLSINTDIANEIMLLKISSTHILCNHTSLKLHVACYSVPNSGQSYDIPKRKNVSTFILEPDLDKRNKGVSVMKWYVVDKVPETNHDVEYFYYMAFSADPELGWSCPVRVDNIFIRKSISVISTLAIPIAVTAYEYKGQMYIGLHHDTRPQMYIENKCGIKLFCAQALVEEGAVAECENFKWFCKIKNDTSTYYSMPMLSQNFPDIPPITAQERLIFSCNALASSKESHWSPPIDIANDCDQYLKIPSHGDIKVLIRNTACLTSVTLESVSKVEFNAKDIRQRLSMIINKPNVTVSTKPVVGNKEQISSENIKLTHSESAAALNVNVEDTTSQQVYEHHSSHKLSVVQKRSQFYSTESLLLAKRYWSDNNLIMRRGSHEQLLSTTIPLRKDWKSLQIMMYVNSVIFTMLSDIESGTGEVFELANFTCDNITFSAVQEETMNLSLTVQDLQLDNQLSTRDYYDFPVVLIRKEVTPSKEISSVHLPIIPLIESVTKSPLLKFEVVLDSWLDPTNTKVTGIRDFKASLQPFCYYLEDTYFTVLTEYLEIFVPMNLILIPEMKTCKIAPEASTFVHIPEVVVWQGAIQAHPLTIRNLVIEDTTLVLSVHSSIKVYVALDQSPLYFAQFERKRVYTNAYRLGHTLTMHYLSGAIFRAGWMVSSLEILGSPAGLARAMGSGLRDFVALPCRGFVQGPVEFLWGVTHGSASLMKHITAGTLQSVTKMASSVARNLDRLTLDDEHVRRTEEQRRLKPQGVTDGILQGLTGLGISILGAIGGIAHHPLQSVITDGASPRSLAAGLGLGIVGVITKPLSGAAELLALTGQGLLQGAGWNSLPEPRANPVLYHMYSSSSSVLKYEWKVTMLNDCKFIHVTEATSISTSAQYAAVALIITNKNLIIMNSDKDIIQNSINLAEIEPVINNNDPTLLSFKLIPVPTKLVRNEDELTTEMDPVNRARVADYVRNTIGLMKLPEDVSRDPSEMSISPLSSPGRPKDNNTEATVISFYVSPQNKNYFLCLLSLSKNENFNTYNYPVL